MPFDRDDWTDLVNRLESAYEFLNQARANPDKKDTLLFYAVMSIWTFGEYAVNVMLELHQLKPDQNHGQAESAKALFTAGHLQKDYSQKLHQLERYRKKASHKGYARERTVHYSSQNVQDCLEEMLNLKAEVESLFALRGKLP